MLPLVGLPKTADIELQGKNLQIRNHQVQGETCLLRLFICFLDWYGPRRNPSWKKIIPQFISQGFKFDAVREQCIKDLRDPKNLPKILFDLNSYAIKDMQVAEKFSGTIHAGRVATEIESRIKSWSDWMDIHREFASGEDLRKKLHEKIWEEFKKWNH